MIAYEVQVSVPLLLPTGSGPSYYPRISNGDPPTPQAQFLHRCPSTQALTERPSSARPNASTHNETPEATPRPPLHSSTEISMSYRVWIAEQSSCRSKCCTYHCHKRQSLNLRSIFDILGTLKIDGQCLLCISPSCNQKGCKRQKLDMSLSYAFPSWHLPPNDRPQGLGTSIRMSRITSTYLSAS